MSTHTDIINTIKTLLGTTYTVVEGWDESISTPTTGAISINIVSAQNLQHGSELDYSYKIRISGMSLMDNDLQGETLKALQTLIMGQITPSNLSTIAGYAGATIDDYSSDLDEFSRVFNVNLTLYICNVTF